MSLEEKVKQKLVDLEIQAAMFDMDIDFELLTLVPKTPDTTPQWIKNYKDRLSDDDRHFSHQIMNRDGSE